jgi:hypothetical protein
MCILFHWWTKWEIVEQGPMKRRNTDSVVGYAIRQQKKCKDCNLVELKEQTVYY